MCTVCVWSEEGQPTLTARNMDWSMPMETNLWVLPAGAHRRAAPSDVVNAKEWTSKYGSVIACSYGIGTADGLNEAGLTASALWLSESQYGERDPELPELGIALWAQYYLDNFATVEEALEDYAADPYQLVTADITTGRPTTVHIQLSDATGDVAILEVIDGVFTVHHGRQYTVLTNSPTFDGQLENLTRYAGFGGDLPLPGTTAAEDRFVRASFYRQGLPPTPSKTKAMAEILSVLHNTAQPYGTVDPERPNVAPTIWSTIADHTNLRYFFQLTDSPYPVWLDLKNLDFGVGAPVKCLVLTGSEDQLGEQSGALVDKEMFEFKLG